jgi:hypothetical protein
LWYASEINLRRGGGSNNNNQRSQMSAGFNAGRSDSRKTDDVSLHSLVSLVSACISGAPEKRLSCHYTVLYFVATRTDIGWRKKPTTEAENECVRLACTGIGAVLLRRCSGLWCLRWNVESWPCQAEFYHSVIICMRRSLQVYESSL